jgi:hypothetical protein
MNRTYTQAIKRLRRANALNDQKQIEQILNHPSMDPTSFSYLFQHACNRAFKNVVKVYLNDPRLDLADLYNNNWKLHLCTDVSIQPMLFEHLVINQNKNTGYKTKLMKYACEFMSNMSQCIDGFYDIERNSNPHPDCKYVKPLTQDFIRLMLNKSLPDEKILITFRERLGSYCRNYNKKQWNKENVYPSLQIFLLRPVCFRYVQKQIGKSHSMEFETERDRFVYHKIFILMFLKRLSLPITPVAYELIEYVPLPKLVYIHRVCDYAPPPPFNLN